MTCPREQYLSQIHLGKNVFQFIIKRIIDKNDILQYYESQHENKNTQKFTNIVVRAQICVDEEEFNVKLESTVLNSYKEQVNYLFMFQEKIKNFPYTATLCISLHSLDRENDNPIASTTIPLYDEYLKLRQGPQILLLWPESEPCRRFDCSTPGLVQNELLEKLNMIRSQINMLESQNNIQDFDQTDVESIKQIGILRNKLHMFESELVLSFIEIEFPEWGNEVIYEDRMQGIKNCNFENQELKSKEGKIFDSTYLKHFFISSTKEFEAFRIRDFDCDLNRKNLTLEVFYEANLLRGDDSKMIPNEEKKKELDKILRKPNFEKFSAEESNLIWKYRYHLSNIAAALPKFLRSVSWIQEEVREEAFRMLSIWATINYDDAIFLLSREFPVNDVYVEDKGAFELKKAINFQIREFAIEKLTSCNSDFISIITLQLVNALRYEILEIDKSYLLDFLIKQASNNSSMATRLYWQLQVESESDHDKIKEWYCKAKDQLENALIQSHPEIHEEIQKQKGFRSAIKNISSEILTKYRSNDQRKSKLRLMLADKKKIKGLEKDDKAFSILHSSKKITTVNPKEASVFRSNTAPFLLSFNTEIPKEKYKVIYKNGDDLRMDQLIIQMISLMDHLMKQIKLDLHLTIYEVRAYSSDDGIMEFVDNSTTLQDIEERYSSKGGLAGYFRDLTLQQNSGGDSQVKDSNPLSEVDINEIDPLILNNYIQSLAGYCVITYILGIGDRHLENLMLDNKGKIFHIDFGFSMGEDPKMWYPPPFKLTPFMIEVLGKKVDSPYREKFINLCLSYFLYIRENAKLILNLLYLTIDSRMVINPSKNKVIDLDSLLQIAQKFILNEESSKKAELYFQKLVQESLNNRIGRFYDWAHKKSVNFK